MSTEVHTWGRGAIGILGHGDEEDCLRPRPVKALAGVAIHSVSCGAYQTAAVTEAGALFTWGWRLDQTKDGMVVEGYATLPDQVHALDDQQVRKVACGHYCTAAVTSNGSLYTWGKGEHGQLGHGHYANVVEPERVSNGALSSGAFVWDARFGKHFLLVLTADGDLCGCGVTDGGVIGGKRRMGPPVDPSLRTIGAPQVRRKTLKRVDDAESHTCTFGFGCRSLLATVPTVCC